MSNVRNTADGIRIVTIQGEASTTDKAALVCDLIMLVIFLWNQIRYGMNMLFLIIPLSLIGIIIVVYGIIPEEYCFTETALEIVHRFRGKIQIPYETVFNYEASAHDAFVNIVQGNTVKVYHAVSGKKKLTVCRPRDVEAFTEALITNCPEFHAEEQEKSRLEVFFDNRNHY